MIGLNRTIFIFVLFSFYVTYTHGADALLPSLQHYESKADEVVESDPAEAIKLYSRALSIAQQLQDPEKQAIQYHKRGRAYSTIGLNGMATKSFKEARQIYSNLDLPDKMGWVILDIGNVYYKQEEKRDVALEHYQEALQLFLKSGDHDGEVVALNNSGLTYLLLNQLDQAIAVYEDALKVEMAYGDTLRLIFTHSYLGNAYRFLDKAGPGAVFTNSQIDSNLVLAHHHLERGLELALLFGDLQGLAQIYEYYGSLYSYEQKYDSALVYFQRSLDQYSTLGNVKMQALQMRLVAEQYDKTGNINRAITENEKLLSFSKEHGLRSTELATTTRLAKYYTSIEAFQQSAEMYAKSNRLNELFQEELSAAQLAYEREIQEQGLALLNHDMELQTMELRHQRSVNNKLIGGSVLLSIALTIIFINLRNQKLTNQILVKKNLEIAERQRNQALNKTKPSPAIQVGDRYRNSNLTAAQKMELFDDVKVYLTTDRRYRSPDCKIEDVAKGLSTNRNYISQIINEQSGNNFSNFINEYRVQDAMQELIDPKNSNLTIEAIAGQVGFNSKSAFNNAFKKYCGITPSAFIKGKKDREGIKA